jgi:hypothetical protein
MPLPLGACSAYTEPWPVAAAPPGRRAISPVWGPTAAPNAGIDLRQRGYVDFAAWSALPAHCRRPPERIHALPPLVSRGGDSRRGRGEEGAFFIFSDACVLSPRKIGDGKIFVTNVKFMHGKRLRGDAGLRSEPRGATFRGFSSV